MTQKLLFLAIAGALGTLARYGAGVIIERHAVGLFPWPTFVVNMVGCLAFGLFYAFAENHAGWQSDVRIVVLTGFMGAFTTYSAFAFQTSAMLRESQWLLAAGNIAAHNILGVLCLLLGVFLGKSL